MLYHVGRWIKNDQQSSGAGTGFGCTGQGGFKIKQKEAEDENSVIECEKEMSEDAEQSKRRERKIMIMTMKADYYAVQLGDKMQLHHRSTGENALHHSLYYDGFRHAERASGLSST